MHPIPSDRWLRAGLIAAAVAALPWPARAGDINLFGGPLTLTARSQDVHSPGGTVFDQSQVVSGALPGLGDKAEYLYLAPIGQNFSGRSTQIPRAFSSALAQADGLGGVGVSSWIAGDAVPASGGALDRLVAQASWSQDFTYPGSTRGTVSLHVEVPELVVGLIGVARNRDGFSATETAHAYVTLGSVITHADGSQSNGRSLEYGISLFEQQVPLGPGTFQNFADADFALDFGVPPKLSVIGSDSPQWKFDALSADLSVATLDFGDTLRLTYTLNATGSTVGGEHGYYAFVGDPFSAGGKGGNLVASVTAAAVPEPETWLLLLAGLGAITVRRRAGR
jgi:hypothetical protein